MHEFARATHTVCHGLSERSDLLDKCRLDRRLGEKHGDKHWKLGLRTGREILCVARTAKVAKTDPGMPGLAAKDDAKRICERFRRDCTKLGFRFADKLNVDDGHGRLTRLCKNPFCARARRAITERRCRFHFRGAHGRLRIAGCGFAGSGCRCLQSDARLFDSRDCRR